MPDLTYPPDFITIRTPIGKQRLRGTHSVSQLPAWVTTRMSKRDVELIDMEAEHLDTTRSYFMRFVAVMCAQYLHKQRTGKLYVVKHSEDM